MNRPVGPCGVLPPHFVCNAMGLPRKVWNRTNSVIIFSVHRPIPVGCGLTAYFSRRTSTHGKGQRSGISWNLCYHYSLFKWMLRTCSSLRRVIWCSVYVLMNVLYFFVVQWWNPNFGTLRASSFFQGAGMWHVRSLWPHPLWLSSFFQGAVWERSSGCAGLWSLGCSVHHSFLLLSFYGWTQGVYGCFLATESEDLSQNPGKQRGRVGDESLPTFTTNSGLLCHECKQCFQYQDCVDLFVPLSNQHRGGVANTSGACSATSFCVRWGCLQQKSLQRCVVSKLQMSACCRQHRRLMLQKVVDIACFCFGVVSQCLGGANIF